jgi:hypothetical protein
MMLWLVRKGMKAGHKAGRYKEITAGPITNGHSKQIRK